MANVLFTNARILDGSGALPYTGDVLVQGNRVARVSRGAATSSTAGLTVIDAAGALVGLDDADGRTLGLGWISAIDTAKGRVTVETRVDGATIAGIVIGRERYRAA